MSAEDAAAEAEHERSHIEYEDLPGVQRRLTEITGWPWMRSGDNSVITWAAQPVDRGPVMLIGISDDTLVLPDGLDAQFIADAPQLVSDLIELVEHYHARFEHVRERALAGDLPTPTQPDVVTVQFDTPEDANRDEIKRLRAADGATFDQHYDRGFRDGFREGAAAAVGGDLPADPPFESGRKCDGLCNYEICPCPPGGDLPAWS